MSDDRPLIAFILTLSLGILWMYSDNPRSALGPSTERICEAESARAAIPGTPPLFQSPAPLPYEKGDSNVRMVEVGPETGWMDDISRKGTNTQDRQDGVSPLRQAVPPSLETRRESTREGLPALRGEAAHQVNRRIVRMKVTAYCPCSECCGKWAGGLTASQQPVTANGGKFCAAPRSIPFFTLIDIPGYGDGPVPVLDRGGAIQRDRLDVFFKTHSEALAFGVQYLDVVIHERAKQ